MWNTTVDITKTTSKYYGTSAYFTLIVRVPCNLHFHELKGKLPIALALSRWTVCLFVFADNVLLAGDGVDDAGELVALGVDALLLAIVHADASVASLQPSTRLIHFIDSIPITGEKLTVTVWEAVASIVEILFQALWASVLLQEKYHFQNLL